MLKKKLNRLYDQMEGLDSVITKVRYSKEAKLSEITNIAEKVSSIKPH